MIEVQNLLLLAADAVIYFTVLAALFRMRQRIGIGTFFCALGVMHFLETYLAAIFYVALPMGIVTSPGSTVLFTGKLMLLLLVYIREDAVVVRQPIYGLLVGNLLLLALAFLMRHHVLVSLAPDRAADFQFLNEIGGLMIWGTAILFLDCIMLILLYERSRAWLGDRRLARLALCGAAVLTFDQVAFFVGLHALTGAGLPVLLGGWAAKMGAVAIYSVLVAGYLRCCERPRLVARKTRRVADVFDVLTYRERYHDLLARSGRDALTGALDRWQMETEARRAIDEAVIAGRPVSLFLIDIDNFKSFNDSHGHAAGDTTLKRIAQEIMATVRDTDRVYRFGGEEFLVLADRLPGGGALTLGERIRKRIAASGDAGAPRVTVSVGIATCAEDAADYDGLFAKADERLYQAKAAGRNCVIGERVGEIEMPVRLVHAVQFGGR